jgi:hypothetical protein
LLIQRPISRSAPVQFGQAGIVIAASDKRFPEDGGKKVRSATKDAFTCAKTMLLVF